MYIFFVGRSQCVRRCIPGPLFTSSSAIQTALDQSTRMLWYSTNSVLALSLIFEESVTRKSNRRARQKNSLWIGEHVSSYLLTRTTHKDSTLGLTGKSAIVCLALLSPYCEAEPQSLPVIVILSSLTPSTVPCNHRTAIMMIIDPPAIAPG
ncbi:hypothetical protein BV22DRAFT_928873 [Leucogyrophana mollusca]|uniref:Uncharacterized protein n=1 Tax=Leucogyrophana mollusca TaxID=85980 RepID=A0ACB8AZD4_9AGAM|nr:hypothetical protein BV22DRAFT_928873 [Leucogyrophana mollusca]